MKYLIALILFLFLVPVQLISQEGPFRIYLSNDFESSTEGSYRKTEWKKEWNDPPWHNRLEAARIVLQDRSKVLRIAYAEGTFGLDPDHTSTPGNGIQFWAPVPDQPVTEIYMSYNVMFKPGFDFVRSGKLPGLDGGPDFNGRPAFDQGFKCGLAWSGQLYNSSTEGTIAFYLYHHKMHGEYGEINTWADPYSSNPYYKFITAGQHWTNITIRLVLNTVNGKGEPGNHDGILEGYINGRLMEQWTGLCLRHTGDITIDLAKIYSFFGGNDETFAARRDEWILFDDFFLFTYTGEEDVPRGNMPSSPGRVLQLPNLK